MVKYEAVVAMTNRILGEYDFPLTLRQIYYRLVAANILPNRRTAYNQLSKVLVKAREKNEVDDTRIEDRARQVLERKEGYDSPESFVEAIRRYIKAMGSMYARDPWEDQDVFVEVWVEKDALARVVLNAAEPYRVTVCPSRGYSSYTYIKRMAIDDRLSSVGKPIVILDFRDHDPSGLQMTEDLANRFNKYGSNLEIEVRRIALTIDQVKEYSLLPNPTKKADPRSPEYIAAYGDECWELDAIEPDELQRIVKESIEECIDDDRWKETLAVETTERQELEKRFEKAELRMPKKVGR